VEYFDWGSLPPQNNIIIHNFWELLSGPEARRLLENLKPCLTEKSLIFIGPYNNSLKTARRLRAEKILLNELGFIFSYPFYKNFSAGGYQAKIVMLQRRPYFLLRRPAAF
jgi:hypothetical protein